MVIMKIREWKTILNEKIEKLSEKIIDFVFNNVEKAIIYGAIILGILFANNILEPIIGGAIIYLSYWIKEYIVHKIEKEKIDSIDIERMGKTIDNKNVIIKKNISDILNDYIEDCFDRDVLFFSPVQNDDYINREMENKMLELLLDSAVSNMSSDVRLIMSKYYGEDSFNKILGRKCMGIITIFTAQHNKHIYQQKGNKNVVEL